MHINKVMNGNGHSLARNKRPIMIIFILWGEALESLGGAKMALKSFSFAQTLHPAMLQGRALGRWTEELDNWTKDFTSLRLTPHHDGQPCLLFRIPLYSLRRRTVWMMPLCTSWIMWVGESSYQGVGRVREARPMVTSDFSSNWSEREVTFSKIK